MQTVPFLKPNIVKIESVMKHISQVEQNCIYSNYGPVNTLFEKQILQRYFHNEGAVTTVNNATIGLMLAISELKRPNAKYALMPSFTFAATPLAAKWCGLDPYFVDVCPDDWCMDINCLNTLIEQLGDEIAVVVPYATFGTYLDLDDYKKLHQRGFPVVIDAAASFGSVKEDVQFGADFPGVTVYSFHATKTFGIGEGGLVYSSDIELIKKIRQAGNFGFSAERQSTMQGLNSKATEYAAAIGLGTLELFAEKKEERLKIYEWYYELLNQKDLLDNGWELQKLRGEVPHQFMSILCPEGMNNSEVVKCLAQNNIEARTYFSPPCHQHPQFLSCKSTGLSVTENISQRIISLPLWEGIEYETIADIVDVLAKCM